MDFVEQGDLELAFVQFAMASTIVLQKIPAHPDYWAYSSSTQRHNLSLVSYFSSLGIHDCASVGMCMPQML